MIRVEVTGYREFAKALRAASPAIARDMRRELATVADVVVRDAKARASWSSRIPGTIRKSVTQKGVAIRAGGPAAPHARLYEFGSSGSGRQFIRHPVFGNRNVWVSTRTRPFLMPAWEQNARLFGEKVRDVLTAVLRAQGLA